MTSIKFLKYFKILIEFFLNAMNRKYKKVFIILITIIGEAKIPKL